MKPGTIYKLVQELKRRRVFRGIVVYGASTLVLLEAADIIANTLGHDGAPTWLLWLLGIGFIGSLLFSWIYDFTPAGIKKTEPVSDQKVPIPRKEVRIYQTTTFVSVLLIIGLLSYNIIDSDKAKKIRALDKSIAVLPYEDNSLSPSQAMNYDFIGREITSSLAKLKDCRIVHWDDCRYYTRRNKNPQEIGKDLNVSLLVIWEPYNTAKQQHLFVELFSVDLASLVWSKRFEINDSLHIAICKISRKISKRITRELRIPTTPQERAFIDEQPISARASLYASLGMAFTQDAVHQNQTGNIDKMGKKNAFTDSISFERAIKYFTDAINEDPSFAEAYANRAKARLMGIQAGYFDRSVMDESREDIERAFEINEDLPEAHVAMGFYYNYGMKEYKLAAVSFEKACELKPNYTEYLFYLSKIYTTLENWREVLVLSDEVFESNSQNALHYTNLGISYQYLDEFSKAIQSQDRAIELMPQWSAPYVNKTYLLAYRGKIAEARATLADTKAYTGKQFSRFLAELDLYEEKYASAAEHIELATEQEFKDLEESQGKAFLIKAKVYKYAGYSEQAKENYSQAAAYYSDQIKQNPENYNAYSKLGLAYAGMGKDLLAIENGQKALELGMQKYSAIGFPFILYEMARTYALTGEHESALNTIQELMNTRSLYTLDFLKIDPDLKPLLDESGFKNLNP
jgi:tetratricopeptide (TPR) repeat protein